MSYITLEQRINFSFMPRVFLLFFFLPEVFFCLMNGIFIPGISVCPLVFLFSVVLEHFMSSAKSCTADDHIR